MADTALQPVVASLGVAGLAPVQAGGTSLPVAGYKKVHPFPLVSGKGTLPDYTTVANDYSALPNLIPCALFKTKSIWFVVATNTLKIKIMGSLDGGITFPVTVVSEFVVTAGVVPTIQNITTGLHTHLQIQTVPNVASAHGKLSVQWAGASF